MNSFTIRISPQYVPRTEEVEIINGKACRLHEVQKRMKKDFDGLPNFTIITAPTGTGKSYAFPFPVLNSLKEPAGFSEKAVRGLIVLPTNALIKELTESFRATYPRLKTGLLTGEELTRLGKTGFDRWKEAIKLAVQHDLLITNPDIINFAMHGGYHKLHYSNKTGGSGIIDFLQHFNYVIFDEYHLYDEAQIANLLTFVKLGELMRQNSRFRFLFVSATPEEGLKTILREQGYAYEEIVERIVEDPSGARAIHGPLTVEFHQVNDIKTLVEAKLDEIRQMLKAGERILLICDQLRDVHELKERLAVLFPDLHIYESSGYESKGDNHREAIAQANIIVATNKAEVGVNYDVNYCIMQPGKYYQNFVQRFGRVARGDLAGKIVVGVADGFNRLVREFRQVDSLAYYDFLEKMRLVLQGKKFYTDVVPAYFGEYLWCIRNNMRMHQDYTTSTYIDRKIWEKKIFNKGVAYARFKLMEEIDNLIGDMVLEVLGSTKNKLSKTYWGDKVDSIEKRFPRVYTWARWWESYLDTYFSFRDSGKIVQVYDRKRDQLLEYSLDWILQHKEIEAIDVIQEEPFEIVRYTVGKLKERDRNITYTVTTIPGAELGAEENQFLKHSEIYQLPDLFKKGIERLRDNYRKRDLTNPLTLLQLDLLDKLEQLRMTFSRKRLKIAHIESFETIW